ncbi:hypothetical protein ACNKHN_20545 [Shigella flexneri]
MKADRYSCRRGQPDAAMEDGDAPIFMNFRAYRAREITRAFVSRRF